MRLRRREFLSGLLATASSAVYAGELKTNSWIFDESEKVGFSILQGLTDETSSQFSLVLPADRKWTVKIHEQGRSTPLTVTQDIIGREFSPFHVYRAKVTGLSLGRTYLLNVLGPRGELADQREFSALDLSPRKVRMGFVSCALDLLHRDDIWMHLEGNRPEMVFFVGDNVYADRVSWLDRGKPDGRQLWERYVATRNRLMFYYFKRLIPVLAIWDDHDFGGDNVGREFPFKEDSRAIFETFFAQEALDDGRLIHGPGIARRFEAFGADFFLMDGRYFRDTSGVKSAKMFGVSQEKWLFEKIRSRPTMMLNGSMFFGSYTGKDSFEGQFASDFPQFMARLRDSRGLFAFVSGDVHFSELQEIEADVLGYSTFELTSSSIHSMAVPGHQWRWQNPRRRASTGAHNYCLFTGEFSENRIAGEIASFSVGGEEFRATVSTSR